jgi:hypothetical protein
MFIDYYGHLFNVFDVKLTNLCQKQSVDTDDIPEGDQKKNVLFIDQVK